MRNDEVVGVVVNDILVGKARISYGIHDPRRLSFFKSKDTMNKVKEAYHNGQEVLLLGCGGRVADKYVKTYVEDVYDYTTGRQKKIRTRLRFYARTKPSFAQ